MFSHLAVEIAPAQSRTATIGRTSRDVVAEAAGTSIAILAAVAIKDRPHAAVGRGFTRHIARVRITTSIAALDHGTRHTSTNDRRLDRSAGARTAGSGGA